MWWVMYNSAPEIPSWSATHYLISSRHLPKSQVSFIPVLAFSVTDYSTVPSALTSCDELRQQLTQIHIPIFCDQGVSCTVADIRRFSWYMSKFGNVSFHVSSLGIHWHMKWIRWCSDWGRHLFILKKVYTMEAITCGHRKKYSYCQKQIERLAWNAFWEYA